MSYHDGFPAAQEAARDAQREIDRIAAKLVRDGVPLWDAIERALVLYHGRQLSGRRVRQYQDWKYGR